MSDTQKRKVLEAHRERLLDLTLRNSLLNFRETGKKVIPIIEELPNEVFRMLVEGHLKMALDPLVGGPERKQDASENSASSKLGLPMPKSDDREQGWLSIGQREKPKKKPGQKLEDLPNPAARKPEYTDSRLQTSLELDDYDRRLANVQSEHRQLLESTGSNFLYLAIGFLKWYAPPDNEKPRMAPLILVPLEIMRTREEVTLIGDDGVEYQATHFAYSVKHSGEQASGNYTLQLKVKSCYPSVDIPEPQLGDDEFKPEAYLAQIATLCQALQLPSSPQWSVERKMGIAFFASGKEVMYRDLNPENWPDENNFLDGKLVSAALGFSEAREEGRASSNGPIDPKFFYQQPIPTVLEADSSQMRALQTALSDNSTVIQGPPGTGKSQTIANLIAALMAEGKKVLFMAEKPEALNVVASRLNEVGLGELCVELHSQKATPKHFQEQLQRRLSAEKQIPSRGLKRILSRLESHRETLDAYGLELTSGGPEEDSLCSAIWRRERSLQEVQEVWKKRGSGDGFQGERFVQLCKGIQLNSRETLNAKSALRKIAKAWEEGVLASAEIWEDFLPLRILHGGDVEHVRRIFENGLEGVSGLDATVKNDLRFFEPGKQGVAQIGPLVEELLEAKQPDSGWVDFLDDLTALNEEVSRLEIETRLASWKVLLESLSDRRNSPGYREVFSEGLPRFEGEQLQLFENEIKFALRRPVLFGKNLNKLLENREVVEDGQTSQTELEDFWKKVCTELGLQCEYKTVGEMQMVAGLIRESSQLGRNVIAVLCDELLSLQSAGRTFKEALSSHETLEETRKSLETKISIRSLGALSERPSLLRSLRELSMSFWKFPLFGEKARAKRVASQLRPSKKWKVLSTEWLDALEQAVEHLDEVANFKNEGYFKKRLGQSFEGIETDWEALEQGIEFSKRLSKLGEGDVTRMSGLCRNGELDPDRWEARIREFERLLDSFLHHPAMELSGLGMQSETNLALSRKILDESLSSLERVNKTLSDWSTWTENSFQDVQEELSEGAWCLAHYSRAVEEATFFQGTVLSATISLNWAKIDELIKASDWVATLVRQEGLSESQFRVLLDDADEFQWRERFGNFAKVQEKYDGYLREAENLAAYGKSPHESGLAGASTKLSSGELVNDWTIPSEAFSSLPLWSDYQLAMEELRELKLEDIVAFCRTKCPEAGVLFPAFELWYSHQQAASLLAKGLSTRSVSRYDLEETITDFRELDQSLSARYRRLVVEKAFKSRETLPTGVSGGLVGSYTEMGLVDHQSERKRRLLPVREFVKRAPDSLAGLFPCWLMSPASVAKFLPPERIIFDVVVIDEASQVKPEDSLGALARARRAVIVGDSKQMPPSNFFSVMQAKDGDDDYEESIGESILEVAESKQCFEKDRLRWHYRSLHQSLISFSNERYYDGELIVPPSVESQSDEVGVEWNYVKDATFNKGLNETEAVEITHAFQALIVEESQKPVESRLTLGLVVMNAKQASRIRELIDQSRLNDASFAEAYEGFHHDDFPEAFVRNLERVQGDERDTIFVGFTYGPSPESGKVVRRFGPINGPAGSRRLNVLLTRAKRRLRVFSSMKRDQLLGGTMPSGGVRDLADYLGFAESGQYYEAGSKTGRDPDSDFEVSVAQLIRTLGYEVDYQVGVAGFFVDLGIRRPGETRYLCGIECDGATYHSHPIARDRDRLRQEILEARGWDIYRVWSTDWFRNRGSETERLQTYLQSL